MGKRLKAALVHQRYMQEVYAKTKQKQENAQAAVGGSKGRNPKKPRVEQRPEALVKAGVATGAEKAAKKKRPSVFPFEEWDSILFVGEGNFSFAHAVAEKLHGACTILATSFDDEATVAEKYPDAAEHIQAIVELGGKVMHGVDATELDTWKHAKKLSFAKIVFNFPHVGAGIKDKHRNILANQTLLFNFFHSALPKLAPSGEILVTLKCGDPYDLWDVKAQARKTGQLNSSRSFAFDADLYPEYSHRRTLGFVEGVSVGSNEEILKAGVPRMYGFVRKPEKDEEDGTSVAGKGKAKRIKGKDGKGKRKRTEKDSDSDE